jgi:hypothetical protein
VIGDVVPGDVKLELCQCYRASDMQVSDAGERVLPIRLRWGCDLFSTKVRSTEQGHNKKQMQGFRLAAEFIIRCLHLRNSNPSIQQVQELGKISSDLALASAQPSMSKKTYRVDVDFDTGIVRAVGSRKRN